MRATAALLFMSLCACGDSPSDAPPAASGGPVPSMLAPGPSTTGMSSAEIEDETSTKPVELLKLVFAADVKDKEPSGQLQVAKPGQKVYAHLTLRNLSDHPRKVKLNFSVSGEKRTQVELLVGESWSWRTWAYNTVLAKDGGKKLELEVTDDEGHPLFEGAIPISQK